MCIYPIFYIYVFLLNIKDKFIMDFIFINDIYIIYLKNDIKNIFLNILFQIIRPPYYKPQFFRTKF